MIDVFAIDRWSISGNSWLHRASTPARITAVAAIVGMLIGSRDAVGLAVLTSALIAALLTSKLPLRPILLLAVTPIVMSSVFAITRLGGSWESALVIIEKGAISSTTMLLLACTTPRTELFRALRKVMPRTIADLVLIAYRSAFILVQRALDARQALHLRSRRVTWIRQVQRAGLVAGLTVLRANELAADQYAAMRLRGYPGHTPRGLTWRPIPDAWLLGCVVSAAAATTVLPRILRGG